jgi:hypothetical protein
VFRGVQVQPEPRNRKWLCGYMLLVQAEHTVAAQAHSLLIRVGNANLVLVARRTAGARDGRPIKLPRKLVTCCC